MPPAEFRAFIAERNNPEMARVIPMGIALAE